MAITKEEIKNVTNAEGTFSLPNPGMSKTELSSFRSRLWQSAKRNGFKVSCSINGDTFQIKTTRG